MNSDLKAAIEKELQGIPLKQMTAAREQLTDRYQRQAKQKSFMSSKIERSSYLASRLPATYAAICEVLQQLKARTPLEPKTLLDLGAGPGTGMWATCEQYPQLQQISLIEKDRELAEIGKRLAAESHHEAIRDASWQLQDLEQIKQLKPHDLILFSYSIGELSPEKIAPLIEVCWGATEQFLVIIEPGTPVGFERIRAIRQQLITLGASLVAPCPNTKPCPMANGDWCHFSVRLERTSRHRRVKEGSLGYEDEKFSYVVASKTAVDLPKARVLRDPLKRSGHVTVTLCTEGIVKQETISKRHPEAYQNARNLEWGSSYL